MNIIEEFTSILSTLRKAASEYYIHLKPIMPDEEYNCLSQVTVKAIPYVETDNSAGGKTVTIG